MPKATEALLKDHKMVRKILEGFSVDNPRFSEILLTLHRVLAAHAWFEDEIFLPALVADPSLNRRFHAEIGQEHQDIDQILRQLRRAGEKKIQQALALQFRTLLDTHFAKEELALFPMGERFLENEGLNRIGAEMQRRQAEVLSQIKVEP